jgi:magnesium-transporting ATPase (P-type)
MLTGESAPVVKYALPLTAPQGSPPGFDAAKHSKHLMLSGTLVLQVCNVYYTILYYSYFALYC